MSSFAASVKSKTVYIPTGIAGFDDVFGGGLVAGTVFLIGGFPGSGKSTLMCYVVDAVAKSKGCALYASAEESDEGVTRIAHRLGLVDDNVKVMGNQCSVEKVLAAAKKVHAFLTVFDSAQKFASDFVGGAPGSLVQCKAVGEVIAAHCRSTRTDRKSTRLNSSHIQKSRMPSSA